MALRLQCVCDGCGTAYQQTAADELHQMRCGKALSARQVAARAGWDFDPDTGRDTCPECIAAGSQPFWAR